MSDIAEFLAARLDEDEAAARAAAEAAESVNWLPASGAPLGDPRYLAFRSFVARHDPARVLREVAAKRAILARWEFAANQVAVGVVNEEAGYGPADPGWPLRADSHELDVRNLAAVYSDHPEYRQEWKL